MRQEGLPPGSGCFHQSRCAWVYGVSTPEQAAQLSGSVDGVIVGSSIVHLMGSQQEWKPAVTVYTRTLKRR